MREIVSQKEWAAKVRAWREEMEREKNPHVRLAMAEVMRQMIDRRLSGTERPAAN